MGIFYSAGLHGFFASNAGLEDAVEITAAEHAALLDAQRGGAMIVAGADGRPRAQAAAGLSLDELRAQAKAKVLAWARTFGARYTAGYTPEEVASWPVKAASARAHLAGEAQALIEAEAALTGETPDALAALIVELAERYEGIVARLAGWRRAGYDAIDAAETAEAVSAALDAALLSAETLFAAALETL